MFGSFDNFPKLKKVFGFSLLVALIVLLRGVTLDIIDLIDPTESRYAWIAQEMQSSGDWLTPKLPMKEGVTPYLGKPPLHFWLTAISYRVFGVHECTSRLPSFIAYILIALMTGLFARRFYGEIVACLASVITLSSGLLFFLSGSSGVDVTLTAFVTGALVFFAFHFHSEASKAKFRWGVLFFLMCSFSTMTKGPIGLILISFPIITWTVLEKRFEWIKSLPWKSGLILFSIIVFPWFIIQEITNPGFLQYFFINENVQRFLIKDYGDRYGTGHVYFRGSSWWMLFLAFMPWSIILPCFLAKRKELLNAFKNSDPWFRFVLIWALSPAIIFTFARQLLAAYLLPSIGGAAIITSVIICNYSKESASNLLRKVFLISGILSIMTSIVFILAGLVLEMRIFLTILSIALLCFMTIGFLFAKKSHTLSYEWGFIQAGLTVGAFVIGTLSAGTYASHRKSTEGILQEVTKNSKRKSLTVGLLDDSAYSAYFYGRSWESELSMPVNIIYVNPYDPSHLGPGKIIGRYKKENEGNSSFYAHYKIVKTVGSWSLYKRKDVPDFRKCRVHSRGKNTAHKLA